MAGETLPTYPTEPHEPPGRTSGEAGGGDQRMAKRYWTVGKLTLPVGRPLKDREWLSPYGVLPTGETGLMDGHLVEAAIATAREQGRLAPHVLEELERREAEAGRG